MSPKNKIYLPNITLCCIDTQYPHLGFYSLLRSTRHLIFDKVLFFTTSDFTPTKHKINNLQIIPVDNVIDLVSYSTFLIKDLNRYITNDHVLIVQWDGFITNPDLWQDHFLKYDYIGAPWPQTYDLLVGNGGFSLRSKKLLQALQDPHIDAKHPEDQCICLEYRYYLEDEHGISFAPPELAELFAFELKKPLFECFGFHGVCNLPLVLSKIDLIFLISQLPPKFIFTSQFSEFIHTCKCIHDFQVIQALTDKVLLLTNQMPKEIVESRLYRNIVKISIKRKLFGLAIATLKRRVRVTGWNGDAIFLLLRIYVFKLLNIF